MVKLICPEVKAPWDDEVDPDEEEEELLELLDEFVDVGDVLLD